MQHQPSTGQEAGIHQLILDSAVDGVIWADRDGVIRVWNSSAEAYLGYSRDEAIGQTLDLVLPERCRSRHWAAFHRWMSSGENRITQPFGVIPLIHRDGSEMRMESTFVRVKDADGNTVGAGAIVRPEGLSART
jgi:PAS domain S-box-containing protein